MKTQGIGRKAIGLLSLVLLAAYTIGGAVPAFASPVSIQIQNGSFPGTIDGSPITYSYSVIHDASVAIGTYAGGTYYDGGVGLFSPITGTLTGDLSSSAGTLTLSGIGGTLTSFLTSGAVARFGGSVGNVETITVTGGTLSSSSGAPATGSLSYTVTGALNSSGTFYFAPVKFLDGTPSPNSLSNNWLYLWANNWVINGNNRPTNGSALGLDLTGTITPVPVPAAALLFGSGLISLAGAMRKKLSFA